MQSDIINVTVKLPAFYKHICYSLVVQRGFYYCGIWNILQFHCFVLRHKFNGTEVHMYWLNDSYEKINTRFLKIKMFYRCNFQYIKLKIRWNKTEWLLSLLSLNSIFLMVYLYCYTVHRNQSIFKISRLWLLYRKRESCLL